MAEMTISCMSCGHDFQVPKNSTLVRCPACQKVNRVARAAKSPSRVRDDEPQESSGIGLVILGGAGLLAGVAFVVVMAIQLLADGDDAAPEPQLAEPSPMRSVPEELQPQEFKGFPSEAAESDSVAQSFPPKSLSPKNENNPSSPNSAPSFPLPATPPVSSNASPKTVQVKAPDGALQYHWPDGKTISYSYTIESTQGRQTRKDQGTASYTVKSRKSIPVEQAEEVTGTGFVVTANGVLATCAHVVDRADSIEVHAQGQTFPARVLQIDSEQDLALLKVEGLTLSPLPLADHKDVQLGESVRALGFPLSDVLGTNLKITQGSLAGILQQDGTSLYQIDAAINPGNSGGPVVNESGVVLGVSSSKLSGEDVSQVGFAVPAHTLRAMMTGIGLVPQNTLNSAVLDGPQLVRSVGPAVVLIRVKSHAVDQELVELQFTGNRTSAIFEQSPLPGAPPMPVFSPFSGPGEHDFDQGTVTVDPAGRIHESTTRSQLPYLLGPLVRLAIDELPDRARSNWVTTRDILLTEADSRNESGPPFGPSGFPGFPRPTPFSPFRPPGSGAETKPAVQGQIQVEYQLKGQSGKQLYFARSCTLQKSGQPPQVLLSLTGDWVFDTQLGVPIKFDLKGNYTSADDQTSRMVHWSARLRTDEELAEEKQRHEENLVKQKEQERIESLPLSGDERQRLLDDLTSPNTRLVDEAIRVLMKKTPESPDPEIARALAVHLHDSSGGFRRTNALQALGKWATPETVPDLLDVLENGNSLDFLYLGKALQACPDQRYLPVLIGQFKNRSSRHQAKQMLKLLGEFAEEDLLKILGEADESLQRDVVSLLGDIGTRRSLDPLRNVQRQTKSSLLDGYISRAVKAIESRTSND